MIVPQIPELIGRAILQSEGQVARKLLCALAHEAPLPVILAALAACKAPAALADIAEGLQAVRDAQGVS